jgi:hypothetical protein
MGEERCIQGNLRERDHLEGPGIDGLQEVACGGMDCIDVA